MTKQEYLDQLNKALMEKVPSMCQEVMEDYETHFEMGLKNGKTEEQICEELGDIDEFVTELAEIEGHESDQSKKENAWHESEGNWQSNNWQSDSWNQGEKKEQRNANWTDSLNNLGSNVADIVSGIQDNVQEFLQQDKVQEFLHHGEEALYQSGTIIQEKIQEYFKGPAFESDRSAGQQGQTENHDEPEEMVVSDHLNLVLEGLSADIIVEPNDQDGIEVTYENMGSMKQQMQYRFYFRDEGDTLYAGIRKSKTAAGMLWGSFSPSMVLTVKLPKDAQLITLNTASGDISMRGVQAREFRLNAASGDMRLYRIKADAMRTKSLSGNIQANQMEVKCLELQTKSGDIHLDDMNGEAVLLSSLSGDVDTSYVNTKEISISSTSGDVNGRNIRAEQMACTSTSGDAQMQGEFGRCRVESVSGDATLTTGRDLEANVASVSGDVRVNLSNDNRGFELEYKTASGELELRYGGEHQYMTRSGRVERGEKASHIYLKTVSGDMTISE